MSAGEYCNREVVIVARSESIREAIDLMRHYHVGDVVVVEKRGEAPVPVGILTDRDIVLEVLAEDVDLDAVTIGDVMSFELVTVPEDTPLLDSLAIMGEKGVRRLPVVTAAGELAGILTVDDVLELLAEQLNDLVRLLNRERRHETRHRK